MARKKNTYLYKCLSLGLISGADSRAASEDGLVNAWTNRMAGHRAPSIEARYSTLLLVRNLVSLSTVVVSGEKKTIVQLVSFRSINIKYFTCHSVFLAFHLSYYVINSSCLY
jgi:hypothetical protein